MANAVLVDDFLETGGYTVSTGQIPVEKATDEDLKRSLVTIERQVSGFLHNPKVRRNRYSIARLARLKREIIRELVSRGITPPAREIKSGSVKSRHFVSKAASGNFAKRAADTGHFLDQKTSVKTPFKGVLKEK